VAENGIAERGSFPFSVVLLIVVGMVVPHGALLATVAAEGSLDKGVRWFLRLVAVVVLPGWGSEGSFLPRLVVGFSVVKSP
jgi:hypothetical protein